MALKKTTEVEKNLYEIEFDVDKDTFEAAVEKVYRKEVKKINIPGFRKGKAPRSMIEKMYGKGVFYDDAINEIIPDAYESAIKEADLKVVSRPEFDIVTIDDNGVLLKAKFFVKPSVEIKNYKGIEVEKNVKEVTEDDISADIDRARQRNSRVVDITDRAVQDGDIANIDYEGFCDGVAFDGGKAENYELQIGSGQFIPGFEDQMIGMKAGETKDINVKFPKNYGAAELAGKAAVFNVTVHEVKVQKMPELTDEYVASLNYQDCKTLKELKAAKKAELEAQKAVNEKDRQVNDIIEAILANANVDMPQSLIQERVDQFKAQYENQAKMYNIPFETFIQLMGATVEQFEAEALTQAKRQALFNVVASKIIEVENLAPTKEALEAKAEAEAAANGGVKEQLLQANVARYYSELAYTNLVDFLLANAVEVE